MAHKIYAAEIVTDSTFKRIYNHNNSGFGCEVTEVKIIINWLNSFDKILFSQIPLFI